MSMRLFAILYMIESLCANCACMRVSTRGVLCGLCRIPELIMTAGQSELQIADWLKKNYWARDPNNNTPCAPIGVYLQTNPYELLAHKGNAQR